MSTRRRQSRVRPGPNDALPVDLVLPGGMTYPARVVDLCCGGVGLYFPEGMAPQAAPGEIVYLRIYLADLSDPLMVASRVRHAKGATDGRVVGVEIVDWLGLLARLPEDLKGFFTRRQGFRVSPKHPKRVEVYLEGLDLTARGHLRDISEMGLSFQVPSNMETALMDVPRVSVSFCPFRSQRVSFTGTIIHRSLCEEGVSCGILFDPKRTENFERNQAVVAKYLAKLRRKRQHAGCDQP